MPTYRLTIEYEGTRYRGWQEQQNARTVAGELRLAMEKVAGPIRDLGGSGRTDAGVHAAAQVAHLRLARAMDAEALRIGVNDLLPPDIHILAASPAHERFHARHEAASRSYLYQISTRRTAFAKRFVWWVKRPLDEGRIREGASQLTGRHDYALFCERPDEQSSTLVVVEGVEVASAGALLLIRFTASHFLWKMVRRLVGVLVELGAGGLDPATFEALLASDPVAARRADPGRWTAPPSGLFLERVIYPGEPPLPPLAPIVPVPAAPLPVSSGADKKTTGAPALDRRGMKRRLN